MTLQTKMIGITIGALFLTLGAIIPSMRILWVNTEQNTIAIEQSSVDHLVKASLDGLYPQMSQALQSVNRDRKLKKAIASVDQAKIKENVVTTFRRLSASNLIDVLEILSKDGNRLYSSDGSTGMAQNPVVKLVRQQNKNIQGLAQDMNGKLYAYVGFPVTRRGKLIGIGLLGKAISDTLNKTAQIDQSQIFILDQKNSVLAESEPFNDMNLELPTIGESLNDTFEFGNKVNEINAIPLTNVEGTPIAHLIHIKDITEKHDKQYQLFTFNIVLLSILFILIIFFLRWFVTREFKGLKQAVFVQNKIADGDLTELIENDRQDEIGELLESSSKMGDKLRSMVSEVMSNASQIKMASEEFLKTTNETNQGMNTQQESIEQLLTAVTEMNATVHEIEQNTREAAEKAHEVANTAYEGKEKAENSIQSINTLSNAVLQAGESINKIDQESHNISLILESIKGIAEQTNLLALNAAIEAARAGEQGRGFAVVADEVRTLAQKTQGSTSEVEDIITKLITCTKQAVSAMDICRAETGNSVEQVELVGESLENISNSVKTISNMSQQIAASTREQASVAEEINSNVVIISDIANRTLGSSKETHNTSKELASMSDSLEKTINVFQIAN